LIDKLLREFAKENFGDKEGHYLPVVHGRTQDIKLFTLVVRKSRYVLERPFKRYTYTVVAGLEHYVANGKREEYEALKNKKVQKHNEMASVEESEDGSGAASSFAVGVQAANIANIQIKINEDLGSLELGGIDQEYILDPDLRDVLAKTELDINKIEVFEDQQLRLITSVIYSQRFAVKGNRKNESKTYPGMQEKGPFSFEFNLEVMLLWTKFSVLSAKATLYFYILDSFTNEDSTKLEEITTSVLKPTKNREERKERVKKYLQWFEEALSTTTTEGERVLTLDKPLNDADCEFLRTIFVPATKNHSTLSFPKFFDEEKLQGYAIVLKIISDLSEETWDEIEKAWAEKDEHSE
ncbi:unnamed protein product, partial [Porites evermanni]